MAERKVNPVFTRWTDPFFGMSRDYLAGLGNGDAAVGYDKVLDEYIESWNKGAEERGMPLTSKKYGLEWIPTFVDGKVMQILDDKIVDPPKKK